MSQGYSQEMFAYTNLCQRIAFFSIKRSFSFIIVIAQKEKEFYFGMVYMTNEYIFYIRMLLFTVFKKFKNLLLAIVKLSLKSQIKMWR